MDTCDGNSGGRLFEVESILGHSGNRSWNEVSSHLSGGYGESNSLSPFM